MRIENVVVDSALSADVIKQFEKEPKSATADPSFSLLISNSKNFNQILERKHSVYVVSNSPMHLYELVKELPNEDFNIISVIVESRFAFNNNLTKTMQQFVLDNNILSADKATAFRFLLQESIMNAIEHGTLGMHDEKAKKINQDEWMDGYYAHVENLLETTNKGKTPVIIRCGIKDRKFVTTVEDYGKGFERSEKKFAIDELENEVHGRGNSLMHQFADKLYYSKNGSKVYFELNLPTSNEIEEEEKFKQQKEKIIKETEITLISSDHGKNLNNFETTKINTLLKQEVRTNGKVLIVDDQPANREIARFYLQSSGYKHVDQAATAAEALEKIKADKPDIILLDIVMPDMNGYEVCEQLKSNPETASIPILFLSALTDANSRTRGYKLGAVDYVNKPINREEMIARTDVHIQQGILYRSLEAYNQRVSKDLERARMFQQKLLPQNNYIESISKTHSMKINHYYEACDELAGDYWSLFDLTQNIFSVAMADFTGHGVVAALNTVRIHALFHEFRYLSHDIELFTRQINERLHDLLTIGDFATFAYILFDKETGKFNYVSCGAPPMFIISKNNKVTKLEAAGLPLGLINSNKLEVEIHKGVLNKGDTLLIYSDALTETVHQNGKMWQDEGLQKVLEEGLKQNELSEFEYLMESFIKTAKTPIKDDLTVLTFTKI